ncbi:MAG: glycosyltransferase [Bacilli bacterium]|nr:glycosyltransferase [Bacilli bacterium]
MMETAHVLGVPFSLLTIEETADLVKSWLDVKSDSDFPTRSLVTANPEIVMYAQGDSREAAELRSALATADLITPDGIGIVMALRLRGYSVPERVTGSDLTPYLLEYCSSRGYRVFLLGASHRNNAQATENLKNQYPGANFMGHDGYFKEDEVPGVLDEIRAFAPHMLLIGLGLPRQEHFVVRYREYLKVPVTIGIGGVIDIFAGAVKRAPAFWIKIRCEWLYRLLSQPSRWRRQLVLPKFAWIILREKFGKGNSKAGNPG